MNETIDQVAMANSVHFFIDVLKREDGNVLRRVVDGEGKMVGMKRTWNEAG